MFRYIPWQGVPKADTLVASSLVHDVCIEHCYFKHMKENFVIPNISFHTPGAGGSPLITEINSSHIWIVQLHQFWLCKIVCLPPAVWPEPPLHLTNLQFLRYSWQQVNRLLGFPCATYYNILWWKRVSPLLSHFTCSFCGSTISLGKNYLLLLTVPQASILLLSSSRKRGTLVYQLWTNKQTVSLNGSVRFRISGMSKSLLVAEPSLSV